MELGNEKGVKTGRWQANEIMIADDINFLSQAQYQTVTEVLALLAEMGVATGSTADLVIAGLLLEFNAVLTCDLRVGAAVSFSGAYWNVGEWGFVASAGKIFSVLIPKDASVVFDAGGTQDRIDTVEIRPKRTGYDSLLRHFKNPWTEEVTSQTINTKYEFGFESHMLKGVEAGSPSAPAHTAGWIKIAEVYVLASASSIDQDDIKDVRDSGTWTTEASHTKYHDRKITYGTADPSGTPTDGDIYLKHEA